MNDEVKEISDPRRVIDHPGRLPNPGIMTRGYLYFPQLKIKKHGSLAFYYQPMFPLPISSIA